MAKQLRVVTYSRCSTVQHQSTDAQVAELHRYCGARDWIVARDILDHGYSGGTDNRPGLRELLTLARSRHIDAIVVTKLDRLFRSLKHLVAILDELQTLGVVFVSVHDQIDLTSASGRLMMQIIGAFSEFERAIIRERVSAGLQHARSKGKRLGRPKLYKDREIIALRSQGLTHREIVKRLGVSKGAVYEALRRAQKTSLKSLTQVIDQKGDKDD